MSLQFIIINADIILTALAVTLLWWVIVGIQAFLFCRVLSYNNTIINYMICLPLDEPFGYILDVVDFLVYEKFLLSDDV